MTYQDLKKEFKNLDVKLLDKFLNRLLEVNKIMNLTSITNKEDAIEKHLYDSLLVSKALSLDNKSILDVGSGGGFPGIPLASYYPNAHFTLLDSTKKKCDYLIETIKYLGLKNVKVKCARVEELKEKEQYDVIVARALADLSIYLELVSKLVKINGTILAMKGKKAKEELAKSRYAIKELSLKLVNENYFQTPSKEERYILEFTKLKSTKKKYPRMYKDLIKRPL